MYLWQIVATCHTGLGVLLSLLGSASQRGQLAYAALLMLSVPANLAAAAMLGTITYEQLDNALKNRTTLGQGILERQYDVGARRNWCQVFGDDALLWLLPTTPRITSSDGYTWPLNPEHRVGGRGGGATASWEQSDDGGSRRPRKRVNL